MLISNIAAIYGYKVASGNAERGTLMYRHIRLYQESSVLADVIPQTTYIIKGFDIKTNLLSITKYVKFLHWMNAPDYLHTCKQLFCFDLIVVFQAQ